MMTGVNPNDDCDYAVNAGRYTDTYTCSKMMYVFSYCKALI